MGAVVTGICGVGPGLLSFTLNGASGLAKPTARKRQGSGNFRKKQAPPKNLGTAQPSETHGRLAPDGFRKARHLPLVRVLQEPARLGPLRLLRRENRGDAEAARSREEELERRYQQEGVSLQWLFIAIAVQGVLTAALVFGLPRIVTLLDFEGGNGMIVCVPVWFLGGLLVGMISPGRTFIEPMVASFVVAIPTTFLLIQSQTVRTMPTFLYVVMSAIGVMFTLIGAYIGERIQLGPPPKAAD